MGCGSARLETARTKVVTSRIVKETRTGSIVLSHDIHPGTIESVPATLNELEAKGFKFVTVSQLISMATVATPTPKPSPPAVPSASPHSAPQLNIRHDRRSLSAASKLSSKLHLRNCSGSGRHAPRLGDARYHPRPDDGYSRAVALCRRGRSQSRQIVVAQCAFRSGICEGGCVARQPIGLHLSTTAAEENSVEVSPQPDRALLRRFHFLRDFNVVDTPGTNTMVAEHQTITENFMPRADLVLFVFSVANPWTQSAWELLHFVQKKWLKNVDLRFPAGGFA